MGMVVAIGLLIRLECQMNKPPATEAADQRECGTGSHSETTFSIRNRKDY